ncbi:MAG: cytochrome c oxidase subunit II [Chloroflexi bacterium]|nr:MAG: cytochrome c oxidase subunit II [Chloroflexota bacterium]
MRIRSKVRRVAGLALLALVISAVLSACNSPNILDPAGPVAEGEKGMAIMVFIVAAVVFVIVISALLYCVIRFRDRPGAADASQLHGNSRLEIAWTIIPSALLVLILVLTLTTMFNLANPPSSSPSITITAIGHQWWWEFVYPDQHIVTADQLNIPVNTVVNINLRSDNVIHSLWVPQLGGKTDVIPGHNNTMWLEATRYDSSNAEANMYRGECTEYCGTQHAHMDFVVVVQTQSDFNTWVTQQQGLAATPALGSAAAAGKQVFLSAGCVGCHQINGVTPATTAKLIGPNLTHFGSRQLIAGGVLDNNPTNLAQWIYDAQAVKNGVDMPAFNGSPGSQGNLTQDQLNNLVAYLESLQ